MDEVNDSTVATVQPADDLITSAVSSSLQQSMKSIELLNASAKLLETSTANATFEQKLLAIQEARKIADSTTAAVNVTTNLFIALGVKVQCDVPITMTSFIPASLQSNRLPTVPGFEADESLPSASKYNLTFTLTSTTDTNARALVDSLLKGTGCQTVGRITGPNFVTIRLENRQQLMHALNILRAATYKGVPLTTLGTLSSVTKSAYSVRSFPFDSSIIKPWFDENGHFMFDCAISQLNESNSGWFPNKDVESVEYYQAAAPPGKNKDATYQVLKIFVSQAAYRHFLRSSHDITNVDVNGELIKVKEEVNIVQCWKCCNFGHYSNQCHSAFLCRFCLNDHAQNVDCPGKFSPQCRLCQANNSLLQVKIAAGDLSPGVVHFKDWKLQPIEHIATSFSCKTIQAIKAMHLLKLKHAAFNRLPLPPFSFP